MAPSSQGGFMKTTLRAIVYATAAATASLVLPAAAEDSPGPGEPTLAEVRTATEKYQDVMGRPAADGAMGVHYFRPDLLGITAPPNPRVNGNGTHTDFHTPAILIYEPQADGNMQLVAVENLVFQASWAAAGHDKPPTFHGVPYDTMQDDPATATDEAHMFEPHY